MFIGEKLIEGYIRQGLQDITTSQSLADAVLSSLPALDQQRGIQWLQENLAQNKLIISQAYPRRAPTIPFIAIVVGGETEIDEPLGLTGGSFTRWGENAQFEGVWFQSTYRIICMTANVDALTWLGSFIKFTLLRYRGALTQLGLYEQTVGVTDILPAEEFSNPEMEIFQRGITVTGKHFAEFPLDLTQTVTSVEITPRMEEPAGSGNVAVDQKVTIPVPT